MSQHDIESTSLPAHVSICQERYQRLADRLDAVDDRITRIEITLEAIHQDLRDMHERQSGLWDRLKDVVIGMLAASTAFLFIRTFLA